MNEFEEIKRPEYEEFKAKLMAEEDRQNHRLDRLEDNYEKLNDLTLAVREMAVSVKAMQTELTKQGERLTAIEKEPGTKWNKAVWYVITAIIGAILALMFHQLGMGV